MQDCRLSKVDESTYVFYGDFDGKSWLYLLTVSSYPDDVRRLVALVACEIVSTNNPGIKFDSPSKWNGPSSGAIGG